MLGVGGSWQEYAGSLTTDGVHIYIYIVEGGTSQARGIKFLMVPAGL